MTGWYGGTKCIEMRKIHAVHTLCTPTNLVQTSITQSNIHSWNVFKPHKSNLFLRQIYIPQPSSKLLLNFSIPNRQKKTFNSFLDILIANCHRSKYTQKCTLVPGRDDVQRESKTAIVNVEPGECTMLLFIEHVTDSVNTGATRRTGRRCPGDAEREARPRSGPWAAGRPSSAAGGCPREALPSSPACGDLSGRGGGLEGWCPSCCLVE